MANVIMIPDATPLANAEACHAFFQQQLLRNLNHWQQHPAIQTVDVEILEERRDGILKTINFGLNLSTAWPTTRDLIVAFAPFMERRGYWTVWQTILEQAIRKAQQMGDVLGETTLTAFLARLSQRQSRPHDVERYYRRTIRLARQTDTQFEEARACSNLGYAYIDGGHWWRSEVLSCHALAIFKALNSEHGRAHTHSHLGVLYIRQQHWDKAEWHLKQACQLWEEANEDHNLAYCYDNLGLLYLEMRQSEKALHFFTKAHTYAEIVGEVDELVTIWLNLGVTYWQMGNFTEAELHTKRAEKHCQTYIISIELAQIWENLGNIYLSQEKVSEALAYFEEALKAYTQLNNRDRRIRVLKILIDYHISQESYTEARHYHDDLAQLTLNNHAQTEAYRQVFQALTDDDKLKSTTTNDWKERI